MTKKLVILLTVALVLGLALAPAAFAKKPSPMPGPPVVKSFDGDVYLFATTPATPDAPWAKISFDLWGETFKFYFKAANLDPGDYTLQVAGLQFGPATVDSSGTLALAGDVASASFTNQVVTLTGPSTLTSFYPISFSSIAPTP
jgi:hypothetical protein